MEQGWGDSDCCVELSCYKQIFKKTKHQLKGINCCRDEQLNIKLTFRKILFNRKFGEITHDKVEKPLCENELYIL